MCGCGTPLIFFFIQTTHPLSPVVYNFVAYQMNINSGKMMHVDANSESTATSSAKRSSILHPKERKTKKIPAHDNMKSMINLILAVCYVRPPSTRITHTHSHTYTGGQAGGRLFRQANTRCGDPTPFHLVNTLCIQYTDTTLII